MLRHLCRSSVTLFLDKNCLHKTSVELPELMVITLCCGGSPGLIMVVTFIVFLFFSSKMFGWYHSPRYFQLVIHNRNSISYFESQDSVVSIAARLRVRFLARARGFPLLQNIQPCSRVHRASCSMGTTVLSPKIKRPEREADHLPPSTARLRMCRTVPLLPHMSSWRSEE